MVTYPPALAPAAETGTSITPAPVEYTVAVDRYLDEAALGVASRRVYRISLVSWAWPLVGKPVPYGADRRRASPPLVPLALLDDPETGDRLAAALAARAAITDERTVNRELSALRSAVRWWRDQGWISADPTAGLRHRQPAVAAPPLAASQVSDLFGLSVSLREQSLWRVLYDSGAPAVEVLALDAHQVDLSRHRARALPGAGSRADLEWQGATSQILRWTLSGRTWGPLFLTDRKAPARTASADVCPLTGQARMSYRRAAEIFGALTRPLDPAGRGWSLHQLSTAERPSR
jgi:integrase/recombinase XerD